MVAEGFKVNGIHGDHKAIENKPIDGTSVCSLPIHSIMKLGGEGEGQKREWPGEGLSLGYFPCPSSG